MIETVGIPILLKAVEALFGEGSKFLREIIQERRRLQKEGRDDPELSSEPTSSPGDETDVSDAITSKEDALRQKIQESAWVNMEARIESLTRLLEIYRGSYYKLRELAALHGGPEFSPLIVQHSLDRTKEQIAKIMTEMQDALTEVYGKKVIAPEVEKARTLYLKYTSY